MRYSKFSIALMCLFASNSFALELVTSSEKAALEQIEQKYEINNLLISANDKLSNYNKKEYEHKSLAAQIEYNEAKYQQDIDGLPEKILSKVNVDQYFKQIQDLVLLVNKSKTQYEADTIALKQEHQTLLDDNNKLNEFRFQKNEQLATLKQQVVERLSAELALPSSVKNITEKDTAVCDKFQSIHECLSDNEKIIISNAKKSDPFLNERSVLLSYEVIDASMNMRGDLKYEVKMSFKPSYNRKIESILNETFGLKSAMLTLVSNVDAQWYIDGDKVGTGKTLVQEVTLGRHGILASYNSIDKSSIEVIEKNGKLTYSFLPKQTILPPKAAKKVDKVSDKVGVLKILPKKTITKKVIKLTPLSLDADNDLDTDNNLGVENKDYSYFMGIESLSEEQDKLFQGK